MTSAPGIGPQLADHGDEALRLRDFARDAMNEGDLRMAAYYNQAAEVHATLAIRDELRVQAERENICPHGGTGLCMYCLIPHIEAASGELARQVHATLSSGIGKARGGW